MPCFLVTDIHGKIDRYKKLFNEIEKEKPSVVFFGGDLLPHGYQIKSGVKNFIDGFLLKNFLKLKKTLEKDYPVMMLILGNDDPRINERSFIEIENMTCIWHYIHNKKIVINDHSFYGYAMVPPTPFRLKDWEKYDVTKNVEPGCIDPCAGFRSVDMNDSTESSSIKEDLEELAGNDDMSKSIFLFHSPPYKSNLDRAALDGCKVDNLPLDVHVGSVAISEFIEKYQPLISLHGHIHESTRLTGEWKERIGRTICFNASHDGPELSIVKFDLTEPENCKRILL